MGLGTGIDLPLAVIAVVSAIAAFSRKVPTILILIAAAALGYLLG
jgi:hypothetical protein